jgi:hypothetical protein
LRDEARVELELCCRPGEDPVHANCASPPCGATRTRPAPGPLTAGGRAVAAGVRQAEVARQLGVSAQAVSVWHARWQAGGGEGLQSRGPSGPAPRLLDAQLAQVEQALLEGATVDGFFGELMLL